MPGDIKTIGDGTFSEKDIKGLMISVETEWGKIDKVFSKAGVTVNSAQLSLSIIVAMQANQDIIGELMDNADKDSAFDKIAGEVANASKGR